MQKVAFIINPHSAKKNYKPFLEQLKTKIENPIYIISKSIEDSDLFIEQNFDKTDVFVAIGGDGTISTVAKKLINTDKILGIFPAGSGNGFSNETQFSRNIDHLLAKLQQNKSKSIDTFTVNGKFSINMAGLGFDGAVVEAFEKTSRGFGNYIKTSIQTFFSYQSVSVQFQDEYKTYNGNYLMVNVANSRQFGNNAFIAPKADLSDGLLEVVLVKKFPFWHAAIFAYRMFTKNLKDNQYIKYLSVPEITFSANSDTWHLDGEFIKIESPIEVKILPRSLKVLTN
jgi:YegS/Rv2252/BmrU family lipid kinase